MWKLYGILSKEKSEDYLIQEAIKMINTISTEGFKESLEIMYGRQPKTPSQAALWFVEGLKNSEFFSFKQLILSIRGNR